MLWSSTKRPTLTFPRYSWLPKNTNWNCLWSKLALIQVTKNLRIKQRSQLQRRSIRQDRSVQVVLKTWFHSAHLTSVMASHTMVPWRNGQHCGAMALWYHHGTMALWHHSNTHVCHHFTMSYWQQGCVAAWQHDGTLASQHPGTLASWHPSTMAPLRPGTMGRPGTMVTWYQPLHLGTLAPWHHCGTNITTFHHEWHNWHMAT